MTRSLFSPAYVRMRESLVAARHSRQLTQAGLAGLLGRPQSFVSKYERGERRLDLVEVLEVAAALGVEPCDLVQDVAQSLQLGRPGT